MMKFATAAALMAATALGDGPNTQLKDGFRMQATTFRSDKGGLVDVIHDDQFTLDTGN